MHSGLGGIAATERHVLFGDRDSANFSDVWRCLNAQTGQTIWEVYEPAIGTLDYGNSPRTTPLIVQEFLDDVPVPFTARAFVLGAFGHLLCLDLETGLILWRLNLVETFQPEGERPWGFCGSPLWVDGKVIVAPGAEQAAVVALDPQTGTVLWTGKGTGLGHGSFIAATLGGKKQIVGHDGTHLRGWAIETGEILWTLKPDVAGDFNVPTPLVHAGQLCVATENNGLRLYGFDDAGRLQLPALAQNSKLRPDMSTPQPVGEHLLAVHRFLYCLKLGDDLQEQWRLRDPAVGDYAAAFSDGERLLVVGKGELLLVSPEKTQQILSRCRIFEDSVEILSHAAFVGNRLYVRGDKALKCIPLELP